MAVDPRIAMGFQAPQIASPMDLAQNAFALKGAMQQNALAEAKMAEMQRQQQSQNALRQLFAGGKMPDAASVYAIDPELGGSFAKNQAEIGRAEAAAAASEAERAGSQYKNQTEMWTDFHTLISGAVDENSYQTNLAEAKARKFDVSKAPPNFDPKWVANAGRAVLKAKERYERDNPTLSFQNVGDRVFGLHPTTGVQVGPAYRVGKSPNASVTNFNMGPLEGEEQKQKAIYNMRVLTDVNAAATQARKASVAIDTGLGVLDKGFTTGVGTDTKRKIAGVLSALGIPESEEYVNDATRFNAAVKEAVLARQGEQKGPQTDQDAIRIQEASAGFSNPTDANRFLLSAAKAQVNYAKAQQKFMLKWWAERKTLEGAEEAWYGGEGGKSLFLDPALAKYAPKEEQASAAAPAAAAPAALPANVAAQLQEGFNTTFSNNQVWTLRNGKPVRVK